MNAPIRILYLDDYPLDRAQVRDALEQEPGVYELTEVGCAEEFEEKLKNFQYDLVLSDFNILGFTGFQALEKVKAIAPRLPVIILTGTGSEEVAAEAIKLGAADYIVKNPLNFRRLTHNFQLILEKEQAKEERWKTEEKYRLLVEQAMDGIFLADPLGHFLDVNPGACTLIGYSSEELLKMSIFEVVYEEEQAMVRKRFKELQPGNTLRTERTFLRKDGSRMPVDINASILPDGRMQGIVRDISERKRMEEELIQNETIFNAFMENSPIFVFFKDKEARAIRLSKNYEQLLGIPVDQALGKTMDQLFPSDLAKSMVADDQRILKEGKRVDVAEEMNGRYYETTKFPIFRDGKPDMLAGFTLDVTERILSEQDMRANEAFNQAIIQNSPIGISVRSHTGGLLSTNPAWKSIWAIPEEDVQEMLAHKSGKLQFDSRDNYFQPHQEAVRHVYERGGSLFLPELKTSHPRPGGAEWVSQYFYAIQDKDGQVDRVVILTEDITLRKRAEAEVTRSREMLERAQQVAHLGSWETDPISRTLTASPEAHRIFGIEEAIMTQAQVLEVVLPEYHPVLDLAYSGLVKNGEIYDVEFKIKRLSDGEIRDIHSKAEFNPEKNIIVGSIQDITERKLEQQAIQESEEKFRSLFEGAQDAIFVEGPSDEILDVNARACDLLGYSREELLGMNVSDLVVDELRGKSGSIVQEEVEIHGSRVFEDWNQRKDGTRIPVEISVSKTNTSQGIRYFTILRDISERKRVEKDLKDQIDILERINNVTVDRELRMLELKKEINALLVKAGEKEKYRIFDL